MDLIARCLLAEIELEGQGCSPGEARGAVRMSRKWAVSVAQKVSPEIRERVALELLESRLRDVVPTYVERVRRGLLAEIGE